MKNETPEILCSCVFSSKRFFPWVGLPQYHTWGYIPLHDLQITKAYIRIFTGEKMHVKIFIGVQAVPEPQLLHQGGGGDWFVRPLKPAGLGESLKFGSPKEMPG